MSKEFEADVKKSKGKPPEKDPERRKDRDLEGAGEKDARETEERERSPLKTPGGTPIIERTPEG